MQIIAHLVAAGLFGDASARSGHCVACSGRPPRAEGHHVEEPASRPDAGSRPATRAAAGVVTPARGSRAGFRSDGAPPRDRQPPPPLAWQRDARQPAGGRSRIGAAIQATVAATELSGRPGRDGIQRFVERTPNLLDAVRALGQLHRRELHVEWQRSAGVDDDAPSAQRLRQAYILYAAAASSGPGGGLMSTTARRLDHSASQRACPGSASRGVRASERPRALHAAETDSRNFAAPEKLTRCSDRPARWGRPSAAAPASDACRSAKASTSSAI